MCPELGDFVPYAIIETLSNKKNGSILSDYWISIPVSSKTSRLTESSRDSLGSIWPPGSTHAFGNFLIYLGLLENKILPSASIIAIHTAHFCKFSEYSTGTFEFSQFATKVLFGQELECANGSSYTLAVFNNALYLCSSSYSELYRVYK